MTSCTETNLLPTPYYRTLMENYSIGYTEEPDFNYGPYDIFCLETRLYPVVYKLFGRNVEIIFETVHEDHRMNLKIKLVHITNTKNMVLPNKDINLSDNDKMILMDSINRIVSQNKEYCLIDRNELYIAGRGSYPKSWYNEVLGYINLDSKIFDKDVYFGEKISGEYNPFISDEGIYLMFNPTSDYKTAYNQVVKHILDTLDMYYEDGVVYGASNIAYDWKLERVDNNEVIPKLYRPTWKDNRFAPTLAEFLKNRITGDNFINIKVSNNLVARHYISLGLTPEKINMVFDGNYIKIPVKDLDEAQYVTSLVLSSQHKAEGKVVTYAVNNVSWIYLYIEAANKLFDNPSVTGYRTTDQEKPFMFSCIIDKHLSTVSVLTELEKIAYSALANIDKDKK